MKNTGILFALLILLMMAGCFSSPIMSVEPVNEDGSIVGLYHLRALDPLMITLLGIPEEKILQEIIDEHGNITIPYIKEPVPAAGLTTSELEREIERIYTEAEIYRNITASIQTHGKIYYMEGEVKRPQEYELSRRITLLQAIAAASGYTDYANEKNVTITRNGQVMRFNAKEIEKSPELDVQVEAGDRIKVYRSPW